MKKIDKELIELAKNNGSLKDIKDLIKKGADVQADDNEALIQASKNGYHKIVELLIKNGADVNDCRSEALTVASVNGHTKVLKLLLDNGVNTKARENNYIYDVCYNDHIECLKLLIDHGVDIFYDKKSDWSEPLYLACKKADLELIKYILNGLENENKYNNVLHYLSEYSHIDLMKWAIDNGADVNSADGVCLVFACPHKEQKHVVKFLLKNGADIEVRNGESIKMASKYGNWDTVKLLVKSGAEITKQCIGEAIRHDEMDIVKLLIEKGGDPNCCYDYFSRGWDLSTDTPLRYAVSKENLSLVKLLIEKGANINDRDDIRNGGENDLLFSLLNKNSADADNISKLLIKKGAVLNDRYYDRYDEFNDSDLKKVLDKYISFKKELGL